MVPDLLRRADLFDLAVVHQHHAVGDFERFFLVVRNENAGDMQVIMQSAQPAAQLFAHLGVERAEGLVEQQNLGLDRQRAGQRNPLTLAARQLRRKAVGQPVKLYKTQKRMHFFLDLRVAGPLGTRLDSQTEGDVLKDRHVAKQRVVLKHEADLALTHMHIGGVFTAEVNAAGVRGFQPGNDAQQRGLAAARGPEQRDQFARIDVETDIAERLEIAEILADVADFDAHVGLLFTGNSLSFRERVGLRVCGLGVDAALTASLSRR